jgi:3-hydroxyisobutyrate dehydrogenase
LQTSSTPLPEDPGQARYVLLDVHICPSPDKLLTCSLQVNHPDPAVKIGDSSPPAQRGYEGGFVTKLAHKDLALAVNAAGYAQVPLELGKRCEEIYRPLAKSEEWSDRDFSSALQALKDMKASSASLKASL